MHCAEGRGRTGVMCACYLIYYYDMEPWDAIRSSGVTNWNIYNQNINLTVTDQVSEIVRNHMLCKKVTIFSNLISISIVYSSIQKLENYLNNLNNS